MRISTPILIPLLIIVIGLSACAGVTKPVQPSVAPQATVDQRVVQADTRFGLELFHKVRAEEPGKNIFLSPTSASLALAMTLNGARGETQQAMAEALSVAGISVTEVNQAKAALQTVLANPDEKVRVEIANSIWYKQGLKLNPSLEQVVRESYRAEVKPAAFGKAGAEKPINQWVAKATNDKIKGIVDETNAEDRMYLINAIYFNGSWKKPFEEWATQPRTFTRTDGTTKQHPMMNQGGSYRYLNGDGFQAAALPYGEGRMSLYIFVPDQDVSLEKFYAGLTPENWETWMNGFAPKQGSVTIPRLKLEYSKELKDALTGMGMGVAFSDNADFSGLFEGTRESLAISSVLQKTYLDMNEKGTEAAAVTAVRVKATAAPAPSERFMLVADRPYFIAIRDDQTGAVLFVGSIVDPQ